MEKDYPKEIHGFRYISQRYFPEFHVSAVKYEHIKHGCPFLYIDSPEDDNNLFSIIVRTPAVNDSGCNHILEHLTLQGSKKYPVKNLFTELQKRTYSTSMNAGTSVEWTEYYFSSINQKAFMCSLDVYLDAVFHPCLDELTFLKEGHHLEFEDSDPNKALKYEGVVYNEMLGEFNNPNTIIRSKINELLYPDSTNRFVYGGLPSEIVNATYDQVKETYNHYYHPSNCLFYHYGSFNIESVFEKVDQVINEFAQSNERVDENLFIQKPWTEPRSAVFEYPAPSISDNIENDYEPTVSWVVGDTLDDSLMTDLSILHSLLVNTYSSPLHQVFIKTQYGARFSNTYFSQSMRNPTFSIGLTGCNESNAKRFEECLLKVFEGICEEGFDPLQLEVELHSVEISVKSPSSSMGSKLLGCIINSWIHDVDPYRLLDFNGEIKRVRSAVEQNPHYFEDLLKKMLIDNPHRLFTIATPSKNYQNASIKKIENDLAKAKSVMNQDQVKRILVQTKAIISDNENPGPVDSLPMIKINDLKREANFYPPTKVENNVVLFEAPTNGLYNIKIVNHVNSDHPLIFALRLMEQMMSEGGAGDMNEEEMELYLTLNSSGINISHNTSPRDCKDPNNLDFIITLSFVCLAEKLDNMIEAVEKMCLDPHLENEQIMQFLVTVQANQINKQYQSSIGTLLQHGQSGLNKLCALEEIMAGAPYLRFIRHLDQEKDWPKYCKMVRQAYNEIFRTGSFEAIIHCEHEESGKAVPKLAGLIEKLNKAKLEAPVYEGPTLVERVMEKGKELHNVFVQAETQSNFCIQIAKSTNRFDPLCASFDLLGGILKNEYLMPICRGKYGAYGVVAGNQLVQQIFVMGSFRDQHLKEMYQTFSESLQQVADGHINEEMVERDLINMISKLDSPSAVDTRGTSAYLQHYTKQMYQDRRDQFFAADTSKIIEAAKRLLKGPWIKIALSNEKIAPAPQDFEVVDLIRVGEVVNEYGYTI